MLVPLLARLPSCSLQGARHKCTVCTDFDLCGGCYKNGSGHEHACKQIGANAIVQSSACGTLWKLAIANGNRLPIVELGGLRGLFAAMDAHLGVASVQQYACSALWQLSLSSWCAGAVLAGGAVGKIRRAMETHASDVEVQNQAEGALTAIAV